MITSSKKVPAEKTLVILYSLVFHSESNFSHVNYTDQIFIATKYVSENSHDVSKTWLIF